MLKMNSLKIDLNRSYQIDSEMSTPMPVAAASGKSRRSRTTIISNELPNAPSNAPSIAPLYEGDGKEDPVIPVEKTKKEVVEEVVEEGEEAEEAEEEAEEEAAEEEAEADAEDDDEDEKKTSTKSKKTRTVKNPNITYSSLEPEKSSTNAELAKLYQQHPECILDYVEDVIPKLNQQYVVPGGDKIDDNHRTYPFLTNFERTKIIGLRANQLSRGSTPFVDVPRHITDVRDIARLELEQKRLPYIIKRPLPNGTFEYWRLIDLLIL